MKSAIVSPSLQDTCVHCSHGMQDNAEAILTDQLPKLEKAMGNHNACSGASQDNAEAILTDQLPKLEKAMVNHNACSGACPATCLASWPMCFIVSGLLARTGAPTKFDPIALYRASFKECPCSKFDMYVQYGNNPKFETLEILGQSLNFKLLHLGKIPKFQTLKFREKSLNFRLSNLGIFWEKKP